MNREQIERWTREAGCFDATPAFLERFAKAAYAAGAAAEREACCSGEVVNAASICGGDYPHQVVAKYQAAIRARGQA